MAAQPEPRWLLKDVDYFAGFAHAMHTYLSGVALASRHSMQLLHQPFQSAHGLNFAFDDFLTADPRGLVPPLVAPGLVSNQSGRYIDDIPVASLTLIRKDTSPDKIQSKLHGARARSLVMLKKGRAAMVDHECSNCSYGPEVREAGLWLRERFWQAVRAHELERHSPGAGGGGGRLDERGARPRQGRLPSTTPPSTRSVASTPPSVVISVHVRRGDVTYLDRYGLPSARWIETASVIDVLRGVREKIGLELAPPQVGRVGPE